MEILPSQIQSFILLFFPLMRVEVFETFSLLVTGILIGEAKHGTVRSSVFARADYQPARISDFFCRHRLSGQALMALLASEILRYLYGGRLPERLFWVADSTMTEKPYAKKIASVGIFHRTKLVTGRNRNLKGHCCVFAALLFRQRQENVASWVCFLCGALLYVKGQSIPELVGQLARHLRLPGCVRHVWVVDRGICSRVLIRSLDLLGQFMLGRMRSNQVVYFAPLRQPRKGRKRLYGQKCRVDQLLRRFPGRLRAQEMTLEVKGKRRKVKVYDAEVLLSRVKSASPYPARVIIIVVPGIKKLKPWYLLSTDLQLDPIEAVHAYDGRYQVEVNFDEAKELGLGHYQGRSGTGVRRWLLLICLAQTILKCIATDVMQVDLPTLNWSWYRREKTVGQVRRRLIEFCCPRISRTKPQTTMI
jgi:Transposase DDE domain